jgi:predicted ATPase
MLTHLKLENFKIWRSTGPLRLSPVTLLLGTNSSGKSTLIQSLLLIRQTVKGDNSNQDLDLGNPDSMDSVVLGQFTDLLCRHGTATEVIKHNQVGIEFSWSESLLDPDVMTFSAVYRKSSGDSAELESLRLGKSGKGYISKRKKPGVYQLKLDSMRKSLGQSSLFRPERSFTFSAVTLDKIGEKADEIRHIGPDLLDELSKIIYLGPVRRLAQRDYVWGGQPPSSIGDDGAKAFDALIASGIEYQRITKRKLPITEDASLFEKTIYWLNQMNLADGLVVKSFKGSARYMLMIENCGELSNVKDVGVGVSQVIPVIVSALFAEPGHIVIVEEPESHLHPLAQSVLSNLFVQVSNERGVQFIVETHSEHLFRRMQTLIAKNELPKNNAALYFVEREENRATLKELQLDDFGRVSDWPDKFFGDAMAETQELARLMFERQSKEG